MTQDTQRIDKWLWYARFLKTRTAATKFVTTGKVRVNKTRVTKPGQAVAVGDILTFTLYHRLRIVQVMAPGARRGPADEARTLYEDLSPAPSKTDADPARAGGKSPAAREPGSGRPTKKQRRELEAWLEPEK